MGGPIPERGVHIHMLNEYVKKIMDDAKDKLNEEIEKTIKNFKASTMNEVRDLFQRVVAIEAKVAAIPKEPREMPRKSDGKFKKKTDADTTEFLEVKANLKSKGVKVD